MVMMIREMLRVVDPYTFEQSKEAWEGFFDTCTEVDYKEEINRVASLYPEERSVYVKFSHIENYGLEFAENLLANPKDVIRAGEVVMRTVLPPDLRYILHLRPIGLPENIAQTMVRELRSVHVERFLLIKGVVRRASETRPRIRWATFQCPYCPQEIRLWQETEMLVEPQSCLSQDEGGCGRTYTNKRAVLIHEKSDFVDTQIIDINEAAEDLAGGEHPESLKCYMEDDLCAQVLPGDRVAFAGILKIKPRNRGGKNLNFFDFYFDIVSIIHEEKEYRHLEITPEDIESFHELVETTERGDIYRRIISSIAPTIHGRETEKEVLALMLFGGKPKVLPDETRIRGDIHVLLLGDPGTAKSQLLRYASKMAPRGIYASGQSASKAGLTAAVIRDEGLGGGDRWTVEAGALVLADRGVACIDELDKMRPEDRSAMHEALEQQTVSVAKAGVNATLQSRCSLLAAANPKHGRFEKNESIMSQLDLPPPLISRFDVILYIKDDTNPAKDRLLAEHILKATRIGEIRAHINEGGNMYEDEEYLPILPIIPVQTLRKYIAYAKQTFHPVMNTKAMEKIHEFYLSKRTVPPEYAGEEIVQITPRQLEGTIRLAEASAKARLSHVVDEQDADRAMRLVNYYLSNVSGDGSGTGIADITGLYTRAPITDKRNMKRFILSQIGGSPEGLTLEEIIQKTKGKYRAFSVEDIKNMVDRIHSQDAAIYESHRASDNKVVFQATEIED